MSAAVAAARSSFRLAPRAFRPTYTPRFPVPQQRWNSTAPSSPGDAPKPAATPAEEPKYSTPLAKELATVIKARGPITLAQYMRHCLISQSAGYYTTTKPATTPDTPLSAVSDATPRTADPFGRTGDFVTSPEISQLFGEMVGVWLVTEWMKQGRRKQGVQLIELGPGRGTLMDDVLRTLRNFTALNAAIESVYMIEASPVLREKQRVLLCGEDAAMTELPDGGFRCTSKYNGIPVTWYEGLHQVPRGTAPSKKKPTTPPSSADDSKTPFVLAHEFFDALPIHAFEATKDGWRELMVAHNPPKTRQEAGASHVINSPLPEFSLTTNPNPTAHSNILPELSARYKALKPHPGSIIEISPDSLTITEDIALRIGTPRQGAALIMDYGPMDTIPVNSLRGIRAHRLVSPFSDPGEVDISADVDFYALAERALAVSEGVEVHGPVEQGDFLLAMGMRERLEMVLKAEQDEEVKKSAEGAFKRLVDKGTGGMGRIYKALAIVPERGGKRPVGFGGVIAE